MPVYSRLWGWDVGLMVWDASCESDGMLGFRVMSEEQAGGHAYLLWVVGTASHERSTP